MRSFVIASTLLAAVHCAAFERVNVSTGGAEANEEGLALAISADGNLVLFESRATNLVEPDTNNAGDIFLRDRLAGTTERLSNAFSGGQAFGGISTSPFLAADQGFAAFSSRATNLVVNDINAERDAFVIDLVTRQIERVSVATGGAAANGDSRPDGISADGRYVLFRSFATNLIGDDTNGTPDMYLRDRQLNTTERVSLTEDDGQIDAGSIDVALQLGAAALSDDGNLVAFPTDATNVVDGDDNAATDIFLRNRAAGTTTRISVSAAGGQGDGDTRTVKLSGDGRYAALGSLADNLVPVDSNNFTTDIFLRNLETGSMKLVNRTAAGVQSVNNILHDLSADGRYLVWSTTSTNLIPGDPDTAANTSDIFVYDRVNDVIARVTRGSNSGEASSRGAISRDGRTIAFSSGDPDLVPNDNNDKNDYFVVANPLFEPSPEALQVPALPLPMIAVMLAWLAALAQLLNSGTSGRQFRGDVT